MKKLILSGLLLFSIVACEKETISTNENDLLSIEDDLNKDMFVFKNWDEFNEKYQSFSMMNTDKLESESFYLTSEDNFEYSPALQGILNKENKFKLDNSIIWFDKGIFYKLSESEDDGDKNPGLIEVGFVESKPVSLSQNGNDESSKGVIVSNQYRFRKQRYVENCGSGKVQGPSPRDFKFVNEAFEEKMKTGLVWNYSLYLRVKLEYNSRGSSWRLSGERRVIDVNLTNSSNLLNYFGQPYITPSTVAYAQVLNPIRFSSTCSSHQSITLSFYSNAPGELVTRGWDLNVRGTITQQMLGDVSSNRWVNTFSW